MSTKVELGVNVDIPMKELAVLAADAFHEEMIDKQMFRSCLNCINYEKKANLCMHYNSNPPPQVIVFSCKTKAWEGDIPF
jgi:hypothetical protein